nr:probable inactive 1-aminocyclopropane-1-carboxylate synthase-like protein 2 [Meriones unguiculatus]
MSERRKEGSSQAPEAHANTQSSSFWEDTLPKLQGQLKKSGKKNKAFLMMQDKMLKLQRALADHLLQQAQCLSPEDQQCPQASWKQEKRIGYLLSQTVNLIWSEAIKKLKFKEFLPHLDSGRGNKAGQQTLSVRPDEPSPWLGGFETAFVSHVLSSRGTGISDFYHFNFQSSEGHQTDEYHKDENPSGYINLGTSENKLCLDLITDRLSQCDMNLIDETLLQHCDWQGQPLLRKELANFLTCYCKAPVPLDPENVVVLNGSSSVFSSLATVLCNPGDAFLIPTPCHCGFAFSSYLYSKVELIPVYLESQAIGINWHTFRLTVEKLEFTLAQAKLKGKKVKGLVLINPQDPLGSVYTGLALQDYLIFAKKHNLHVIVDESYMLSVFDDSVTFHSVLSIKYCLDPKKIHMIWGTSKDFGMSGFCFGVLYTHNKEVASAVKAFGYLHGVPGIAQYKLYRLLQDREWINRVYLPINLSRLQKAFSYVTKKLRELNIPFSNCGSGLFLWINLKTYLSPCTFEQEQILLQRFQDNKLLLCSGRSYMCKEPGWFCLLFAEKHLQLKVAMDRLAKALNDHRQDMISEQIEDAINDVCFWPSGSGSSQPAVTGSGAPEPSLLPRRLEK